MSLPLITIHRVCSAVALLSALAISDSVLALGAEFGGPVTVSSSLITGTIGNARNAADGTQYIYLGDRGSNITVYAKNAAGTTKSCVTNNGTMMAALRGITDGSRFYVTHNNAGTCNSVIMYTGSPYQPKKH